MLAPIGACLGPGQLLVMSCPPAARRRYLGLPEDLGRSRSVVTKQTHRTPTSAYRPAGARRYMSRLTERLRVSVTSSGPGAAGSRYLTSGLHQEPDLRRTVT